MTTTNATTIEEFIQALPKIELHAHIGGSIRESTIRELAKEKQIEQQVIMSDNNTLKECFQLFSVIHQVTDKLDIVKRITSEILYDFYHEDNCKYIGLY
jgi:adenosine deaminase